jgi:hypothetical protein
MPGEVSKPVEVNANLGEWLNNGVGNFIYGIDRQRKPLFSGLNAAGWITLGGLVLKGLTLPLLFTPAGLPILGASAIGGAGFAGLSYLFEKRHNTFATTMPTSEGDKKVKASFGEWLNNSFGNFFLGKERKRAPIFKGALGVAVGGAAGLIGAPFLGPAGPIAAAIGAGIVGAASTVDSVIGDVRRPAFKSQYPLAT